MTCIHLYVKQHKITKLKYFGMTRKKDPYTYIGSGKYWRRHIKKHGNEIDTLHVWTFNSQEESTLFALNFSKENNITESSEWANLQPENALTGHVLGTPGLAGEKNPGYGKTKELNAFYGKKHSIETIQSYRMKTKGGGNGRAIPVETPFGKFTCIKHAAEAEKIDPTVISRRIKNKIAGYFKLTK